MILRNLHTFELCTRVPLANNPQLAHDNWENPLFVTRGTSLPVAKESLFCHRREPLFSKSGKSDIFCLKKFAMSLFRTIFAFENGREVKQQSCELLRWRSGERDFGSRLPKVPSFCLRSAFALPPLWLRFRRRRKTQGNAAAETRHKQEFVSS